MCSPNSDNCRWRRYRWHPERKLDNEVTRGTYVELWSILRFRRRCHRSALAEKRAETAAIDVIAAEDIGKFPDSNLAESMQRVPGVTLSRGDGGEGRAISVRVLGPLFTRVRINGMEAAAERSISKHRGHDV